MVREIVHCQVGQCGNQIGNAFWQTVGTEHLINNDGTFGGDASVTEDYLRRDKLSVYYRETVTNRFVPRAILVDLEPGVMDAIQASEIGDQFSQDNFVFGAGGAGNVWAKGHYTEGNELIDDISDVIRREVELCDSVQGIQLAHSLGGGTGSGLGTLMLLKIREAFPDIVAASFSVFPSKLVSDVVVENYNAILSVSQLLENADETFVLDNESLFNISQNILHEHQPTFNDLNYVVSLVMSGVTSSLRFPGKLNGDLRKMAVNLVPFPRLHFFLEACAPLGSQATSAYTRLDVRELSRQCWDSSHFLASVGRADEGKYLSAALTYRGNMASEEVDAQTALTQSRMAHMFVNWIPHNMYSSIVNVPASSDLPMSASFVANTTSMKNVFGRISTHFKKMYKRKAFLYWYTGEGMDEAEFEECDGNVRDLIMEYQEREDVVVEEDGSVVGDSEDEDEEDEF